MITRKLTNAIRRSIAIAANAELNKELEKKYLVEVAAYVAKTPKDVLAITKKYPSLARSHYVSANNTYFFDYGNAPKKEACWDVETSPVYLSLSSIGTFDQVAKLFPALVKYLPK